MKLRTIISLVLLSGIIGFGFSACDKNRACKVSVIVQDALEEPLAGKLVHLTCDPVENTDNGPCIIEMDETTLSDGRADFEFANPAILEVYIDGVQSGYVELVPGENVEKTITIP